jgi:transposase
MLANELDYVLGVDTHRDEHVMAVVTAPVGAVVAGAAAPANARGYRELLRVAERHAPGRRAWAIEGTGSYGAALGRYLRARGECVLEASRAPRGEWRLRGKDDALDAARTARAALAGELALPRAGERREALRLLLVARRSAVDARRQALTQVRAVIVTAPEPLRQELRRLPERRLLDRCSRLRRSSSAGADELATRMVLRSLARRAGAATLEADELEGEILAHVRTLAPTLLDEPGVGAIVAAQLLVAWSHRGRLRSEACFARLAGVAPIPASSGQTTRHRLSRGGDRQQPGAAHGRPAPPPARSRNPRLHRPPPGGGQECARGHPAAQALPRPPPLPAATEPRAADGLTGHRSFIRARWRRRTLPLPAPRSIGRRRRLKEKRRP